MTRTLEAYTAQPRVAYFSMEIAVRADIPTYSGGLGVLAGDTMRSAADLEIPMVAVTLVSRAGYFKQVLTADGRQSEEPDHWAPERHCSLTDAKVALSLAGRRVWVQAWLYEIEGLSLAEISVALDCPVSTLHARLSVARRAVETALARAAEKELPS